MYIMEIENEEPVEAMTYTLDVAKPKKQRKSRAKPKVEPIVEDVIIEEPEEEVNNVVDNDFLSELNNNNIIEEHHDTPQEPQLEEPIRVLPKKRASRAKPKKEYEPEPEPEEEIYSEEPTPIYGKDRLVIMQKIQSYKLLFPTELKTFKICKSPSLVELENALMEIETIIELGNVDSFITDSIVQCIKLAEGVSAYTKNFNITGLAMLLKQNKQFHSLLKMLYLKYNTFSAIPPEAQLGMIVATTALICVQKNKSKKLIDEYLDEPMTV
jgi:hypothetical protein